MVLYMYASAQSCDYGHAYKGGRVHACIRVGEGHAYVRVCL